MSFSKSSLKELKDEANCHKIDVTTRCFFVVEGKLLCVKNVDKNPETHYTTLPGGDMEDKDFLEIKKKSW